MPEGRPSWAAEYIRQYCQKCPACGSIWSKTEKRCTCGYDFQTKAMGPPSGTGSRNWLWPDIDDLEGAEAAGKEGSAAAFIVAAITTIFAVLSYFDVLDVVSPWALIDAGAMAVLGFLIHRMSRTAAVIALVWFIVARIQGAVAHSFASNVLLGLILQPGFISGIRGTLAYHRLVRRIRGLKSSRFSLTLVFTSSVARMLRRKRRPLIES